MNGLDNSDLIFHYINNKLQQPFYSTHSSITHVAKCPGNTLYCSVIGADDHEYLNEIGQSFDIPILRVYIKDYILWIQIPKRLEYKKDGKFYIIAGFSVKSSLID